MFIPKKLLFFQSPSGGRGVKNVRGSKLFQGDGTQLLFFSIELVVFQGVPDSLYPPPWIRASPMCTCPCLWPFKVTKTKHAVSSSKA